MCEWRAGISTDVTGNFSEVSNAKEEQIIRNWRQGKPCYKLAKNWLNYVSV